MARIPQKNRKSEAFIAQKVFKFPAFGDRALARYLKYYHNNAVDYRTYASIYNAVRRLRGRFVKKTTGFSGVGAAPAPYANA